MSKETLSMREAKRILDESARAVNAFEKKIESGSEEFEKQIAVLWEDENAVRFIKTYWSDIRELLTVTENNYKIYATTVKDIAVAYAKAGGMQQIVVLETTLPGSIAAKAPTSIGKVQNHFPMSDEFGFIDIETGPDKCRDLLDEQISALYSISGEAAATLDGINAFGNQEVKQEINAFFKSILQNTMKVLTRMKPSCHQIISNAARTYKTTGDQAKEAPTTKTLPDGTEITTIPRETPTGYY